MSNPAPFSLPNIRLFIAFRVLFNARFYYPVFSILYLDYGLTLSQFAILNAVWAATIVLCEVPSGAIADLIGRRRLLIVASSLMVAEMLLLILVPPHSGRLLFGVFVINRVLSGMAEAAASGADEALAYDSLAQAGWSVEWPRVLERLIQAQSIGFIFAMLLGALVYDPLWMQRLVNLFAIDRVVDRAMTLKLPIYLTLVTGFMALYCTLRFKEVVPPSQQPHTSIGTATREAFRLTAEAGRWILRTPFVFMVIIAGVLCDSTIRMILTMASQYYRLIEVPEVLFGGLGAALAALGLVVPTLARRLEGCRPVTILLLTAGLMMTGLVGISFAWPLWGILPAMILFSGIYLVGFFTSLYLNRETESHRRATVLSFKGLAFNLGYGALGLLYSGLLAHLQRGQAATLVDQKNQIFADSLLWFPAGFTLGLIAVLIIGRLKSRTGKAGATPPTI